MKFRQIFLTIFSITLFFILSCEIDSGEKNPDPPPVQEDPADNEPGEIPNPQDPQDTEDPEGSESPQEPQNEIPDAEESEPDTPEDPVPEIITYSIEYKAPDAESGSVPVDSILYEEGSDVVIMDNVLSLKKTGYVLLGWSQNPGAETPDYVYPGTITMGSSDLILYAVWGDLVSMKSISVPDNGGSGITFPIGVDDDSHATVFKSFSLAETELTNLQAVEILQWALDNGKLSETASDHNGVSSSTVKYGNKELIDLDLLGDYCKIEFNSGTFSVETGYEDCPVLALYSQGAVMLANWLTEMKDGHADNVVYTNIPIDGSGWSLSWITVNNDRNGYRIPRMEEWEYAARYLGTDTPVTGGSLDTEYVSLNHNDDGSGLLTSGYYWTPGDYSSGAYSDIVDTSATSIVAVHNFPGINIDGEQPSGSKRENTFGLYDMSGNAMEWVIKNDNSLVLKGGCWNNVRSDYTEGLQIGYEYSYLGIAYDSTTGSLGTRFCRTE